MSGVRVERSSMGYGTHVWIGNRIRVGTPGTMTPMWPHVSRSFDEFCNDVLAFHLFPIVAVDWWWRRKQRTSADGRCASCREDQR